MSDFLDNNGLLYFWQSIKSKFLRGNAGGVFYGTSSTAAGTVAKVVECADFTADNLKAGTIIIVSFTATNSGAVATGTDGTMYGAKAELSDVALAVKGDLKAQFKITSGEQELRTEIFTINNGEALDAGDGDWAGDLDGHNLDEMAQDIEDVKAAVSEMESDVSDLQEDLNDKVDKVTGKGLSTNDYTNEDKQKVTDTASDVSAIKTATDDDIGKALMIKTVADGEVTEWEFGATSSGDISLATPVTKITGWVEGKYYDTSGRVSATVDVNSPIDSNEYETVVLPCNYEDYFIINSTGSEGQRSWAFLDENYTIIMNANPSTAYVDEVIQANYGAAYLIINKLITDKDCYIGRTVTDELAEQDKKIDAIGGVVDSLYGITKDAYVNCYNGKYGPGLLNDDGILTKSIKNDVQQHYTTDFLEVEGDTHYVFSYETDGAMALFQIAVICQYDSGKRFISKSTAKTNMQTSANCKYLRLCVPLSFKSRLDRNFMVSKGTSAAPLAYIPYTERVTYFGSVWNRFYSSMYGERTVNSLSDNFGYSSAGHICFGSLMFKSDYEVTTIVLRISNVYIRFNNIVTGEWNRIAGVGKSDSSDSFTSFQVRVTYADGQSHPFTYKNAIGFDETALFGAGNELSADSILGMLTEKSYEHEYFTLMTDLGVASPVGRMVSARKSVHSQKEPYFGFTEENGTIISSEPNSGWSGWDEIGTYGQSQRISIPIYNKVHGTLETDGMFSAIPFWGAWSQNASLSNEYNGGHVFHGWSTDRQHRLTMTVNIYRNDEAAIFNYVPGDKAEGSISGEGKFLRLRLGADNLNHGVLIDNVYNDGGGYYTRLQIRGPLNIKGTVPSAPNSDGLAGDVCFDANYVYFCVADNTWKRIPLQSW